MRMMSGFQMSEWCESAYRCPTLEKSKNIKEQQAAISFDVIKSMDTAGRSKGLNFKNLFYD